MGRQVGGKIDGWVDGWFSGSMNGCVCVVEDHVPRTNVLDRAITLHYLTLLHFTYQSYAQKKTTSVNKRLKTLCLKTRVSVRPYSVSETHLESFQLYY